MEQEELSTSCSLRQCRICHEEEDNDESHASMESPCACSGSLKYAHRGCVQRWCDEKGSTLCEICLQNFEAGYNAPPKKVEVVDVAVIVRESLEAPQLHYESQNMVPTGSEEVIDSSDYTECLRSTNRNTSWCRFVAVAFTIILLLRHLVVVLTVEAANHCAFSLLTIYLVRVTGILLPFYIVMRLIWVIQQGQQHYQLQLHEERRRNMSMLLQVQEQQHILQVG